MQNDQIIGALDPEYVEKLVDRKAEIDNGSWASPGVMTALAVGSVPVVLAALSRDVYGQTAIPAPVKAVFDFALALEIFENEFYRAVLNMSLYPAYNTAFNTVRAKVTDAAVLATLAQIQKHEQEHVATLLAAGATDVFGVTVSASNAKFDFTGNRGNGTPGPFAQATTDVDFLLATAQGAEDTGVRAYKGQAPNLMGAGNFLYLENALRIHSVEARHAARIRRIRRMLDTSKTVLRYSGTVRGGGAAAAGAPTSVTPPAGAVAAFAAIYAGEDNTSQGGVTLNSTTLANTSSFSAEAFAEAFDEPLDRPSVVAIVQPFFIPTIQ